jgi:lysophospholipase L1-like esterase
MTATTTGAVPGVAHADGDPQPGRTSNHRLRIALSGLLVVLVATAVAVRMVRASASTPAPLARTGRKALVQTPLPQVSHPASATVVREFGGCQLSLSADAPIVPVGSCTVLEIGDSLGSDLGWGLAREVPAGSGIKLVQLDKSSTGLANSGYYDWPAELETALGVYHPQLVLVCLGGNDEQAMVVDGSAVQFPSSAWTAAYLTRVRQLLGEATASGALVMWVGMPIMEDPGYSQGMKILNALYQQAVVSSPDAVFLPTWQLFANPESTYQAAADVNGTPQNLREPDGIHYALAGEDVIATYVVDEIASIFHVQLAPASPATITGW